jgi:hypothetical protein
MFRQRTKHLAHARFIHVAYGGADFDTAAIGAFSDYANIRFGSDWSRWFREKFNKLHK